MPGVLIEAGLSGMPVVATDVPGVRSVVADGETGLVVGVDDLPGMTAGVSGLLADPARRAVMGRAARDRCVERFSMDAVGTRWEAMLEPLVDSGPAPRRRCRPRSRGSRIACAPMGIGDRADEHPEAAPTARRHHRPGFQIRGASANGQSCMGHRP